MNLEIILVCATILGANAALPPYIQPCSRSLPTDQLSACITQQARNAHSEFVKGIPEFNLEPLDPLALDEIVAKTGTFNIKSKNLSVKGLKKMEIKEINWDLEKGTAVMKVFGNLTFHGNYEVDGKLLLFPFKGNGKLTVRAYNTDITIRYKIRKAKDSNGVEHIETYDLNQAQKFGKVQFRMTNLLGGAQIGETINNIMNENWRDLIKELGPPYTKAVADKVHNVLNQLYKNVPYEELLSP